MASIDRVMRRKLAGQHEQYFRLTPLFQDAEKKLIAGVETYVIHTKVKDLLVAVVNGAAVSADFAKKKEQELMALTGLDVIVTDRKVKFMKVEPMTPGEVAVEIGKADNIG